MTKKIVNNMKELTKNLKQLGFNIHEITVYKALTQLGEASISKIALKCNLPRTTTASILERFLNDGYVTKNRHRGKFYYWIESPKVLESKFLAKAKLAKVVGESLSNLYLAGTIFPSAEIYDRAPAIKNFTEKLIFSLQKGDVIRTIDSPNKGNYKKIFSGDFNRILLKEKKKRGIITKTLVPYDMIERIDQQRIDDQIIELRELPKGVAFGASIWVVKDLLVLFSGHPPFAIVTKHQDINLSITSLFEYFWSAATRLEK